MEIDEFKTAGQWFRKMKAEGYTVPLTLYYTLERMIKEKRMSFQQAYGDLLTANRIKEENKVIIFDLNEKS